MEKNKDTDSVGLSVMLASAANNEKVDNAIIETVHMQKGQATKYLLTKFLCYFLVMLQYFFIIKMHVDDGPSNLFLLITIIISSLLVWLPRKFLAPIGQHLKFDGGDSSGGNMHSTPVAGFRFLGWVLLILPQLMLVI